MGRSDIDAPDLITHLGDTPPPYKVFIPLILICLMCTLFVLGPEAAKIYQIGSSERKANNAVRIPLLHTDTLVLQTLPIVVAGLKLFEVLMPRQELLAHFLSACWEAYAFYCFLELIVIYLDGPEGTVKNVKFGQTHKTKIWAAPPIGCWFRCLCRNTRLGRRSFKTASWLVYQFVVFYPLTYFMDVMKTTDIKLIGIMTTLSLLVCMYGLVVLLWGTHDVMVPLRPHRKFWGIKGILILNTLMLRGFEFLNNWDVDWLMGNELYDAVAPGAWAAAVTAVACVPLSFLSQRAYCSSEFHLIPLVYINPENPDFENAKSESLVEMMEFN